MRSSYVCPLLAVTLYATVPFVARAQSATQSSATTAGVTTAGVVPFPKRQAYAHKGRIQAAYDRFRDTAVVRMAVPFKQGRLEKLTQTLGGPPAFAIEAGYVAQGEPPTKVPAGVVLAVTVSDVVTPEAAADSGASATSALELVLAGGERVRLDGRRVSRAVSASGKRAQVVEVHGVAVPTPLFLRIVNAAEADGRILGREFSLRGEPLEALRDFASRMAPVGVTEIAADADLGPAVPLVAAGTAPAAAPAPPGGFEVGETGSRGQRAFGDVTVSWTVVDDGSAVRDTGVAPGEPLSRTSRPCSAARVCAETADLRVTAVAAPRWVGLTVPFTVAVEIENRGRTASKPAEVALCRGEMAEHGACRGQPLDVFTLPALQAGEVVTARQKVTLAEERRGWLSTSLVVAAVVDPDRLASEANYSNNWRNAAAASAIEAPKVEILSSTLPSQELTAAEAQRPVVASFRVRNAARVTATGEIEFLARTSPNSQSTCRKEYPKLPFSLPSIPARAVVDVAVTLPPFLATCSPAGAHLSIKAQHGSVPGTELPEVWAGSHWMRLRR